MIATRSCHLVLFFICCAVVAGAYCMEFFQALLPCSLCVIQRLVLEGLAISFLACFLHNPKRKGLWVYSVCHLCLVIVGLVTSGRQIWLQNQPVNENGMCLPVLPSAVNHSSVMDFLNNLGTHQCAEAGPYFLGINLSLWTFLLFILMAVVIVLALFLSEK